MANPKILEIMNWRLLFFILILYFYYFFIDSFLWSKYLKWVPYIFYINFV